ncbi:MAG: radical SAM protein [Firmicutes bacterium]|nr:radical SAM protein [Candidatus Fermentithermobacillaceae bacterium]
MGGGPDAQLEDKLNLDMVPEILDELARIGVSSIGLTGGEPMVRPDLVRAFVSAAALRGMIVGIETNATLLSAEDIDYLAERCTSVSVSLDSLDPEYFDSFRNLPGAHSVVLRTIKALVNRGARVQVIMSVCLGNVAELGSLSRTLLTEFGVSSVKFNVVSPATRGKDLMSDPDVCVEVIQRVIRFLRQTRDLYWGRLYSNVPMALLDFAAVPSACGFKRMMSILPDGSVSLCGTALQHPELRVAVNRGNLGAAWANGSVFRQVREIEPRSVKGVCSICMFGRICANLCPATVYDFYGSFFYSHPWCQMFYDKGLFPEKFVTASSEGARA